VFRRGFSSNQSWSENKDQQPELLLTRKPEDTELDDEVLHVSNAPLFFSTDSNNQLVSSHWNPTSPSATATATANENDNPLSETNGNGNGNNNWQLAVPGEQQQQQEMLVMATTQDIFYFEYGCVVFWGLTSREEKAAITELSPFTVEPVSPVELEKRY
jgi:uncharacterized Rmd1/YagE family protein